MTNVRFHNQRHYFAIEYKPFNHESIRQIISGCCKETLEKIMQNNSEIKDIEHEEKEGNISIRKLNIKGTKRYDKNLLRYKILCQLKNEIDNYFLRNADEIDKYRKLIEKRCSKN